MSFVQTLHVHESSSAAQPLGGLQIPDCACLSCRSYKLCSAEMQIQQSLPPSSFPLPTRLCLPVLLVL